MKPSRSISLTESRSDEYLEDAALALTQARLSKHYPSGRLLASHLRSMTRRVHQGLYDGLEVDRRSGLPAYKEWLRVQTDHEVAPRMLGEMPPRVQLLERARARPDTVHGKTLLQHDYYRALVDRPVQPQSHMDVALRRVEPESRTAYFHVTFDKLDATGVFVRYSIDLCQRDSVWCRPMVVLDDDHAEHTEGFRSLIYRFTSLDAEFTFAKLAMLDGVTVERVVKGVVGPVFVAEVEVPAALRPLFEHHPGGMVATFGLDMAARDVATDKDNDPLVSSLAGRLDDDARREYEQARHRFGYKVFRDRKMVATPGLNPVLEAFCKAAGTRNIIVTLRRRC